MSAALLCPLVLVLGIALLIITDLIKVSAVRSYRLALLTLALAFISTMYSLTRPIGPIWGYLDVALAFDGMSGLFSGLAVFLAFIAVGLSWGSFQEEQQSAGEYYTLMVAATLGAVLVVHAKELLTFFIAFELLSIPLYMLTGFRRYHRKSAEAGLKYFLSGALSSALFLFGASWVYGASGSTLYADLPMGMTVHVQPLVMGLLMILAAFAFKLSAAPFHMWAPDTYEGAPIPVAAFLSVVPKAAMFAAALRLFGVVAPLMQIEFMMVLSALSVLSIMVGNLVAITQREVTRMAAYSGIAQVGYLLIGLAAVMGTAGPGERELAVTSMGALLFYLLVYTVTNMAFWLIILTVGKARGRTDLDAFDGLSESCPFLAFALLICAMSLAGVPLAGFVGKLYLFRAAAYVQPVMAIFGVVGSVLSLVYYFGILRRCYFLKPPADAAPFRLAGSTKGLLTALLLLAAVGGMVPHIAEICMQVALRIIP